jgi:hypothetical protein
LIGELDHDAIPRGYLFLRCHPNLVLRVAAGKEAIEVVAANESVVPLDTGETRTTLNQNMVDNMMTTGRNAAELVKIMPGMSIIGNSSMLGQDAFDDTTTKSNTGIIGRYAGDGTQPRPNGKSAFLRKRFRPPQIKTQVLDGCQEEKRFSVQKIAGFY